MSKAYEIFETCFKKRYLCDLSMQSFGVRKNGTVALMSLRGKKPIDFSNPEKLSLQMLEYLQTWCIGTKANAQGVLTRLTSGLEEYGFNPEWNQMAVEQVFPFN